MSSTLRRAEIERAKAKALALEKQLKLRTGLPFLHGWKWYKWARAFFDSTNKTNLLTAANQISKSSTQIRKCIDWSTDKKKWPDLWANTPSMFWYFYPSFSVATVEFEKKWKQFLPKDEFKNDPVYGWKEEYKNKEIYAIHFKSGVSVYFHSYSQAATDLQTGTVEAMFCDEEMPMALYDELMFRLSATDGYFHMVFTATLGQEFWRRAMEPEEHEEETLPGAFKQQVSMYDCQYYDDGTPSHWTIEKIQSVIDKCKNHKEVLRRVFGKFVREDGGMKYEQFDMKRHLKPAHPLPKDWFIYAAVDIGSGDPASRDAHPAAICFIAVRPDYRAGRVFLGWRGDGQLTTAGDVMTQFQKMRDEAHLTMSGQAYDWGSKDFGTIAGRIGEPFVKADKSRDRGAEILNDLFKNDALIIYETEELQKLATELISLRDAASKKHAKDDLIDALRYAAMLVPWDFEGIAAAKQKDPGEMPEKPEPALNHMQKQIKERREFTASEQETTDDWDPSQEIAEWNEAYGNAE